MAKQPKSATRPQGSATARGGTSASDRAAALQARWTQLGRRHVVVGGACACGHGQSHLRPDDFEYFVLDHLTRKYRASGHATLLRFLEAPADAAASLHGLLGRLAQPEARRALSAGEASLILDDVERSLESFAESAM